MADSNKTEKPTQKRIKESKEKGEAARSTEVSSVIQMIGFLAVVFISSRSMLSIMVKSFYTNIEAAGSGKPLDFNRAYALLAGGGMDVFAAITPALFTLLGLALLSGIFQSGFSFAEKALSPNFSKLNPINGFSRLFSARSWVELLKAIFKIGVIFAILYNVFMTEKDRLLLLSGSDVYTVLKYSAHLFTEIIKKIAVFLIALSVVDYMWQKHDYMSNLKMSREEVKEELKQTEGDLRTKAMIRNWHKRKIKHAMLEAVKKATFVTVNPTHYAVAVKYERGMKAPKLLAKGADFMAQKIRELAKQFNVPVIKNPELTRSIYFSTEVGRFIPPKLFKALAKVLVFIYKMEREKKNGR
jgi:flagellar biosynthetic protein FlhB